MVEDPTEPSPSLDEFWPKYQADDNEWWRLRTGDMQNLFDEAMDRVECAEAKVKDLRKHIRWAESSHDKRRA